MGTSKSFEDKLTMLEQIVGDMENNQLSLEDSLGQFEKGVGLYRECKKIMDEAESRISILTENLKEESFE